jgi:acyl-coenzyme A synthetase/AMP-(fatty) acid ligase
MNLADILDRHANERPEHPAIEFGERIVSYRELTNMVSEFASVLHAAGVRRQDIVCVMLPNFAEHIALLFALAKLGAIHFALDPRMTAEEQRRALSGLVVKLLVAPLGTKPLDGLPMLSLRQIIGDAERFRGGAIPPAKEESFDEANIFTVVTSSGTTGSHRRIPMSHGQIAAWNAAHAHYTGLTSSDRYLSVVHLNFIAGSRRCILMLRLGATVVINREELGDRFFAQIAEKRVTCTFLTPGHLGSLIEQVRDEKPAMPDVKLLISTSRLTPEQSSLARQRLTPHLYESYGINEAGLIAVATPEDRDSHPNSVGRLIDRVTVEIVDDQERPVPPGSIGAIRIRGPHVTDGYFGDWEETSRNFREGWFYPGDLAMIDEDDYVFLIGRADDVINNSGVKFYPIELESPLQSHPGVREAAVIGWPHEKYGEVAVAFVVCAPPVPSPAELMKHCRERVAGHKLPQKIVYLPEMPKNSMGKIVKGALRRALETGGKSE